jgi:DNA-binding MarR family transcriptional regulator
MRTSWNVTRRLSPRVHVQKMKRDVYGRLDVHNYPLKHPLGHAEPTTPWMMNLADVDHVFWALCFDFDGKILGAPNAELMEQAADQCAALSTLLHELSIQHVVCESSGTGGRHLWITLREGASPAEVAAVAMPAGVIYSRLDFGMLKNPATGAARPPLSPHRDGSYSRVLHGDLDHLVNAVTTPADLAALAERLEAHKPALVTQESAPSGAVNTAYRPDRGMSRTRDRRSLSEAGAAHMATVDGGRDPSWTGFVCLLSAAAAGWSFADVENAVQSAPGLEHFRTKRTDSGRRRPRNAAETHKRLALQWEAALKRVALQRPLPQRSHLVDDESPEDLTVLETIVSNVEGILERFRVNPGRWGASEATSNQQTILRVIAYLSLHTGKAAVAASIRDVGPMAGLGRTTADAGLKALAKAGYVERVSLAEDGNAAEWQLTSKFSTASRTVRSQPLTSARPPAALFNARAVLLAQLETELTDQRHDLFSRRGLGHLAGKLFALLREHAAVTVDSAAKLLGVSSRHTATILGRLRVHKLIVTHRDGWAMSKRDLRDQAAAKLGLTGTLAARVESYRVEREVWAWWLAELITMKTPPGLRPRRPHFSSRPLFGAPSPGERVWPRYPRDGQNRAQHTVARQLVANGNLNPESRWQYLGHAA